jgi:hypothetical protein
MGSGRAETRPQANIIRRLMLIRHAMRSHGRRHLVFMGCGRPGLTLSPGPAVRAGCSDRPSSSDVLAPAAARTTRATSYRSGVRRDPGGLSGARQEPGGLNGARQEPGGPSGARQESGGLTGVPRDPGGLNGARQEPGGPTGARRDPGGLDGVRRDPGGPNGACWEGQPSAPGIASFWNVITGTSQEAGCAPPSSVPWTAW